MGRDVYQKIVTLKPGQSFSTTRDDELDLAFWRLTNGVWEPRGHTAQQLAERHDLTIEMDVANDCFKITKNRSSHAEG